MSCISGIRTGIAEATACQSRQICRANSRVQRIAIGALTQTIHQPRSGSAHRIVPHTPRIETPQRKISTSHPAVLILIMKEKAQLDTIEQLAEILDAKEANLDDRFHSAKELAYMAADSRITASNRSRAFNILKRLYECRGDTDLISLIFATWALVSTDFLESTADAVKEEQMREFLKSVNVYGWVNDFTKEYEVELDDANLHISIRNALIHKEFYPNFEEWLNFAESDADSAEIHFLQDSLFSIFADVVLAKNYFSAKAKREIRDFWNNSYLNYGSRILLAAAIQKIAINDPDEFHEMIDLLTQLPENLDQKFMVKKLILLTLIEIETAADPKNRYEIRAVIDGFFDDLNDDYFWDVD